MRKPLALCALGVALACCAGANYRTPNFVVEADTAAVARQVGQSAELWRLHLAQEWLGNELPTWPHPCHVKVCADAKQSPNGRTRLLLENGKSRVLEIKLEGPLTRILDSVLPHEITHAVFATHFARPLPRWADEGASTVVEHPTQRAQQQRRVAEILLSGQAVSIGELFIAPDSPEHLTAVYVQGYSLTQFLLAQGGKQKFVGFLDEGLAGAGWSEALESHYGFRSLGELQAQWLAWAMPGF